MITPLRFLAAVLALFVLAPTAQARAQDQWDNVQRIVVFGDLHGDYDKFVDMARTAGLIDARGDWAGGRTHFVQLGDVPDRAPDTRRILDHLMRLERQAQRAGGYVHALIGNHEAMNMTGDLRYTVPGEFAAFTDRNSSRRRDAYYARYVAALRAHPPAEGLPTFDAAYRARFDQAHPLGWVEHQTAWAPTGTYGRWIVGHSTIIRINDNLFMHGGIGPAFATSNVATLNAAVVAALRGRPQAGFADILGNQQGPLWYRGLALNDEAAETPNVEAVLANYHVRRIVLGHTKRNSTVYPRFGGRVLLTDIAVPDGFTDPHAFLVIENGTLTTVHRGQRVTLDPSSAQSVCGYLGQIGQIDSGAGPNATLATQCAVPQPATTQ